MRDYDHIYTLNYFEFWDKQQKCIHLHGKINLRNFPDIQNAILISEDRMNYEIYANTVRLISKYNNVIKIRPNDVIFAPMNIRKEELICVAGLYPSAKLYPADDLFLYEKKELYRELDLVDEIDVFGMSPFGDESIIDKLNSKKMVRIYVYDMENNTETKVWRDKLICNYELLDSNDII